MTSSLHITEARALLNSGEPVTIYAWKQDGSILEMRNAVSLRYSFRGGWRYVKVLASGQVRRVRDVCIFRINDFDIYI